MIRMIIKTALMNPIINFRLIREHNRSLFNSGVNKVFNINIRIMWLASSVKDQIAHSRMKNEYI
jgi:hypothetical protein